MSHGDHVAREVPTGFAHNPIATIPPVLAHIEWATGNTEAATDLIDETIASLVRARADANSMGFALTWATLLGAFERDADRVDAAASQLRDHSNRTGGLFWGHIVNWDLGTAELLRGNANGLALAQAGSDGFVATGALQHVPFLKLSLVEGHILNGDTIEALGVLEVVSDLIQRTEQRFYEPEMHRLRGVVLVQIGRHEDAALAYETAVAVAEGQGSIPWRDRAAANLVSLATPG
jgi:hypothetical protein